MHITSPDPLLTLPQAADYLGGTVSVRTLRRLIQRGDLRAVRISSSVRVRTSALEDFLNQAEA